MASSKQRPRRPIRRTAAGLEADRVGRLGRPSKRQKGALPPQGFLSFAQAVAVTGIGKYRIGEAVKRAGLTVYRSPGDARRKYLREEDVERLTGAVPETPAAGPPAGAPDTTP